MSKEDITEISIIYNANKHDERDDKNIKIFGSKFVRNNKNICKMIIDDKEYEIKEKYNIEKYNNDKLKIKLKGIDNIINMMGIFHGCLSLLSLPDISKWNTNKINDMSEIFYGCSSLLSIPDISKWNTNNVNNISFMFMDVHHYYLYLIFQNGILIKLLK